MTSPGKEHAVCRPPAPEASSGPPSRRLGAAAAIGASWLYMVLYRPIGMFPDLYWALPISKEVAHPGTYAAGDLLVSSGMRVPFHLYRLIGWLSRYGLELDAIQLVLSLVLLLLTLWAVWCLSLEITRRADAAALATALVAVMPSDWGTLNASKMPLEGFVTATAAVPLALAALTLGLRGRHLAALVLAGLTFDIHPYVGLLTLLATSALVVFRSEPTRWTGRLKPLVAGALAGAPNAVFILVNLPSNFSLEGSPGFLDQLRVHAFHIFIEDHWRDGYGWFFLILAAAWLLRTAIDPGQRRRLLIVLGTLLGAMAISVVNAYLVHNKALLLAMLFRATYLIKPMILAVVCAGMLRLLERSGRQKQEESIGSAPAPSEPLAAAGIMLVAASLPQLIAAEAILLIGVAALVLVKSPERSTTRRLGIAALATGFFELFAWLLAGPPLFLVPLPAWWPDMATGIAVAWAVLLGASAGAFRWAEADSRPCRAGRCLALALLIVLAKVTITAAWLHAPGKLLPRPPSEILAGLRLSEPHPEIAALVSWVRSSTPSDAMIQVPPLDRRFDSFRVAAERGVYVLETDINQLSFDVAVYGEAGERLRKVGVTVLGRHRFDAAGYRRLGPDRLVGLHEREGLDYWVVETDSLPPGLPWRAVAYQDRLFTAVNLEALAGLIQTPRP